MANEPYHRVSQDNGVINGTLIGASVGAGGAAAGIFGARMNYNAIENKVKSDVQSLEAKQANLSKKADKYSDTLSRLEQKVDTGSELNRRETSRGERSYKKYDKVAGQLGSVTKNLEEITHSDYLANKQAKHAYSKMGGGWRKAGIIGASAVIGGGLGMGIDGIAN